jgi:DNA-binding MarR family transcriptional regulator
MQEPLENLSQNAQRVQACLAKDPSRNMPLEDIADETGLKPGETADALRSLEATNHASEGFRGWAVHLST